jgi:NAD(P)H-nitrite reductase large subunit
LPVVEGLDRLGVNVVLGERVVTWPNEPEHLGRPKILRTDKGRQFEADLVLPCTGQKPHVSIMAGLCPLTISPITSRIRVHPTMQVSNGPVRPVGPRANTLERLSNLSLHAPPTPPASNRGSLDTSASENDDEDDLSHVFAVGDCAETGAIQAGHTAYWQAEVAARNIIRLIERQEGRAKEELENYKPGPPAIKVSLGLKTAVTANGDEVKVSHEGVEDLQALIMW